MRRQISFVNFTAESSSRRKNLSEKIEKRKGKKEHV